jgi:dual specificity phosphatase 12
LRRKEALKKANITHVVSALRLPLDKDLFVNYKHHIVELDDVGDENIIEHFAGSNAFIQEGLDGGGGVLVHWWVKYFSWLSLRTKRPTNPF